MRSLGIEIAFVLSVLAGCASSSTEASPPSTPAAPAAAPSGATDSGMMAHHGMMGGEPGAMAAICPMEVKGTTARAEDVDGGAALVFTTTGDLNELRARVSRMAEMHNQHHANGHGQGMGMQGAGATTPAGSEAADDSHPMHHEGMGGGMMMGMVPPSTARTEEVEGGARLVLTPKDPADLSKLRDHVKQHAEQMGSGQCPMMAHPMHSSRTPEAQPIARCLTSRA